MRLHPGSSGFWRNWRNHYGDAELLAVLTEALRGSAVYLGFFDGSGQLLPDAISYLDAIYDSGGGDKPDEQPALRELTSVKLNLAVSTSDDPSITGLQNNDDICLGCAVDIDDVPGAAALLDAHAPCAASGNYTIGDIVDAAEASWSGQMPSDWRFAALSADELTLLQGLLSGINHGQIVVVDPSTYPDDPGCLELDVPRSGTWYLDADGDGHGVDEAHLLSCGSRPAGRLLGLHRRL